MTYKIWVWQLGDIFVVGVPGEPYTELQVMIREAVPEKHVIVSVNTNGAALARVPAGRGLISLNSQILEN